jgi:biopolymer transport protein ExbD
LVYDGNDFMAMQLGQGGTDEPMMEINTTPLIDVMLVLLVMLIITIPIQMHAVRLDMPVNKSDSKPPEPPRVVKINIEADGQIRWNGELVGGRADLEQRIANEAQLEPQAEVHIRPDRAVQYQELAMVLSASQRLGLQKLGVVGNDQFVEQP